MGHSVSFIGYVALIMHGVSIMSYGAEFTDHVVALVDHVDFIGQGVLFICHSFLLWVMLLLSCVRVRFFHEPCCCRLLPWCLFHEPCCCVEILLIGQEFVKKVI